MLKTALTIGFSVIFLADPYTEPELTQVVDIYEPTEEEIDEEIKFGEMELVAQVVQAEAGDQGLYGMRLVVDVILNRVDSPDFPDTIEEVIFQKNQFSVMWNGAFDRAGYEMSEDVYKAVEMEWEERIDYGIIFFSATDEPVNGKDAWKYGDHWFSY